MQKLLWVLSKRGKRFSFDGRKPKKAMKTKKAKVKNPPCPDIYQEGGGAVSNKTDQVGI